MRKIMISAILAAFAVNGFAATHVEDVDKIQVEAAQDDAITAQRQKINELMKVLSQPLPSKNLVDWFSEVSKETFDKYQAEHRGLPEKPAKKNQYGGYDRGVWLTEKQETEFKQSKEFANVKAKNDERMGAFLVKLDEAMAKLGELSQKGETLTREDVEKVEIPVLPALTEREVSFMFSPDIEVWEGMNKEFIDHYVRPQKEKLLKLTDLNVEMAKYEQMLKARASQLEKQVDNDLKSINENAVQINTTADTLGQAGFTKDAQGNLVYNPKINVKMPNIKDFMSNCYLLDENHEKSVDDTKTKNEVEVIEKAR